MQAQPYLTVMQLANGGYSGFITAGHYMGCQFAAHKGLITVNHHGIKTERYNFKFTAKPTVACMAIH